MRTLRFHSSNGMFSLPTAKLMLGGMSPFSKANATLMIAARPLAVSKCPMLDLTEPTYRGSARGQPLRMTV